MRPLDSPTELAPAAVAILDAKGKPAGTGFFAGNGGLIVTAAHVLTRRGDPPDTVQVEVYAGRAKRTTITALVLRGYFFGDRATDIALLRLRGAAPQWACYLEPGSSLWCAKDLEGFGFPELEDAGFGSTGTGHQRLMNPPRLQLTSEQITPGYSGGPLVDRHTLAVVAVTQSIRSPNPNTEKLRNESFGVPIETVGAALARAWVERPADAGDDGTDALVAEWIDRTSRAAGPRHTWGAGDAEADPVLTDAELQALAQAFCGCLGAQPDGEVLWRLPAEARGAARSRLREGGDWREGVFDACRSSSSGLRLLAASLIEAECSAGIEFDEQVRRLLMLRYTEKTLRERAGVLRRLGLVTALRLAAAARVDLTHLADVREGRDWLLYLVRRLAAPFAGDALEQVMQSAARWQQEGPPPLPPPRPPPSGECSLVVVVREDTGGGLHAVFRGIPHQATPPDQEILGTWAGSSLADPAFRIALWAAERHLRRIWHTLPSERITVEFALPRRLFAEEVEQWIFDLTDEPLGAAYPVVLRSTERMYDPNYQASWADWDAKWLKFAAEPALHWLAIRGDETSQSRRNAIKKATAVSLCNPHSVNLEHRDDPIRMCIQHMVPVALWRRSGDDSQAKGPEKPEHVIGLPAWVWTRRQAASAGELDDNVVLLWDDPRRIPSDAQAWRENLVRRTVP